ncbi:hypothetical protein M406DRAFT_103363 [Cryphonectria parasitica EP155]|uniref:Uncharacterized protein n=1 Tax=Cryphonectria parasitica (strain ATCC 38755 / EP155) TaxID=660469 RepID=A0A9P4XSQ1_CRYP1|nr:uncharacterized protein M406DRAFT_103363 [Cryphonectria parasitica EP155]KAF3760507.1 hypothetical protein M406DRAFT_103363 [Cryphonectria parasitica EP155]
MKCEPRPCGMFRRSPMMTMETRRRAILGSPRASAPSACSNTSPQVRCASCCAPSPVAGWP